MQTTVGVSIFVILCTVVASSVSTAIPHWINKSEVHSGLWKACGKAGRSVSVCVALPYVYDWVQAVRALMILGTILLGISLLLACSFARELSIHSRANGCILCLISGGILLIIAVIVFASNVNLGGAISYDSAFYLAIAAAVVAILTAAVVHKDKSSSTDGYTAI